MLVPLQAVKLKINGRCMNSCRFCVFHSRDELLELADVQRVVEALGEHWRGQVILNGGEPTIHPRFVEIAEGLNAMAPGLRRGLGTNLRLFEAHRPTRQREWCTVISCFSLVQVGCDDEHANIDIVELRVPELRAEGLEVYINCLDGYYSARTRDRLLALDARVGSRTRFSSPLVHANFSADKPHPDARYLCDKRRREVLIDCDGSIYFCFHQEFIEPAGNLHHLDWRPLADLLLLGAPERPYRACAACPYRAGGGVL